MENINVQDLSSAISGFQQCKGDYKDKHEDYINECLEILPSGSGIDNGVKLDLNLSSPEKIVFTLGFHHLHENGYYDGWTEHKVIIVPSLQHRYNLKITGKDRNFTKDYLHNLFSDLFC